MTCPNMNRHKDVVTYCAKPLEKDWMNAVMLDWAMQGFPGDAVVLECSCGGKWT